MQGPASAIYAKLRVVFSRTKVTLVYIGDHSFTSNNPGLSGVVEPSAACRNSRKHPEKIIAPIASPNQMLPPLLKMGKDWRTHEPPNVPDFGRSKLQFDPCPFRQATSSPQDSWGLKGSRADSQASPDPKTNGWTSQM